ncbi:MAG: hypothetical protein NT094_01460 [Candidatus Staskawiczbacteria bacterium]|nr:hypothetical protein [Candidatus Staskawiczbacteria bacterium]
MKKIQIEKMELDLTETLKNNICCVQSLDKGTDRSRVKREILRMLKNSWIWKEKNSKYGYIKIK